MNPIMQLMNQNNQGNQSNNNMLNQFMNFKNNFNGNDDKAAEKIAQMLYANIAEDHTKQKDQIAILLINLKLNE